MFNIHISLLSKTKALENEIDSFHDKLIDASLTFSKAIKTYLKGGFTPDLTSDESFPSRWEEIYKLI